MCIMIKLNILAHLVLYRCDTSSPSRKERGINVFENTELRIIGMGEVTITKLSYNKIMEENVLLTFIICIIHLTE
jgi:hypothetical protein